MLFSEPKIPQSRNCRTNIRSNRRFQCSSASRKFLNRSFRFQRGSDLERFSALQRAENSSIAAEIVVLVLSVRFSALQRAENSSMYTVSFNPDDFVSFSALQRAENSSIRTAAASTQHRSAFQCSSASRKFLNAGSRLTAYPPA